MAIAKTVLNGSSCNERVDVSEERRISTSYPDDEGSNFNKPDDTCLLGYVVS
jgi:hypothetical protein